MHLYPTFLKDFLSALKYKNRRSIQQNGKEDKQEFCKIDFRWLFMGCKVDLWWSENDLGARVLYDWLCFVIFLLSFYTNGRGNVKKY